MVFADADSFWRAPSVYDVATLLGLALSAVSIWLAFWLAKRDIAAKLDAAEKRAVAAYERAARAAAVAEIARTLAEVRAAVDRKQWPTARHRLQAAQEQLARLRVQFRWAGPTDASLTTVQGWLGEARDGGLADLPTSGRGQLAVKFDTLLADAAITIHEVEGTSEPSPGTSDGRET